MIDADNYSITSLLVSASISSSLCTLVTNPLEVLKLARVKNSSSTKDLAFNNMFRGCKEAAGCSFLRSGSFIFVYEIGILSILTNS